MQKKILFVILCIMNTTNTMDLGKVDALAIINQYVAVEKKMPQYNTKDSVELEKQKKDINNIVFELYYAVTKLPESKEKQKGIEICKKCIIENPLYKINEDDINNMNATWKTVNALRLEIQEEKDKKCIQSLVRKDTEFTKCAEQLLENTRALRAMSNNPYKLFTIPLVISTIYEKIHNFFYPNEKKITMFPEQDK